MIRNSQNTQVANLSAYEAVLAIHYFAERLDQQTLSRTLPALQHAVEIEPSYARAWTALSQVYCNIHALRLIDFAIQVLLFLNKPALLPFQFIAGLLGLDIKLIFHFSEAGLWLPDWPPSKAHRHCVVPLGIYVLI